MSEVVKEKASQTDLRAVNEAVGVLKGTGFLAGFTLIGYEVGSNILASAMPGPEWIQGVTTVGTTLGAAALGGVFAVCALPGVGPESRNAKPQETKKTKTEPAKDPIPITRRILGGAAAGATTLGGGAIGRLVGWGLEVASPAAQEAGAAGIGTVIGLGLGAVAGSIEYVVITDKKPERVIPEAQKPEVTYSDDLSFMEPEACAANGVYDFDPDLPSRWIAYEDPDGIYTTPKA